MSNHRIEVSVIPQYLPDESQPDAGLYTFAYTIRVENVGDVAAQLIARHWRIEDAHGHVEYVNGLGVVGHQPLLEPGEKFEYSSGARIKTPTGKMSGHYFFVTIHGDRFDAPIPEFSFDAVRSGDMQRPQTLH